LPVDAINLETDFKEINDGTLSYTGHIRSFPRFLVIRQPCREVVDQLNRELDKLLSRVDSSKLKAQSR
jgi:hypothetical protein